MDSNENFPKFSNITDKVRISRRTFFMKSVGYTSALTLLSLPCIMTETLAANGEKSKDEILKELEAKVEKYMPMYRSCAQPSFTALNEQFELKADRTIPALMPFAGGVAGKGETCGAVTGSLLAIGYYFEPVNQMEMEKAGSSIDFGALFFERFKNEFGSTRCKEVIKHQYGRYFDFENPEELNSFFELSKKSSKCLEVVKKAVLIAGDIILENS